MTLRETNKNLINHNSFHLPVCAKFFACVSDIDDIQKIIQEPSFAHSKKLVIGGGSNILFTQPYFDGLVIHNCIMGREIIYEDDDCIIAQIGAGEIWHDIVMRATQNNRGGIENLALIPGCIGSAPIQNIGAYGREIKDVIVCVDYINMHDGGSYTIDNSSCQFAYRESIFKQSLKDIALITHVTIRLFKMTAGTKHSYTLKLDYKDIQTEIGAQGLDTRSLSVQDVATIVSTIRTRKLPDWKKIGTAGSFFKNPIIDPALFAKILINTPTLIGYTVPTGIKLSAGQLIEYAGLKGIQQGSVGTYQNHALVLVHHGGGTGADIISLAQHIQDAVYAKFSVWLEPEVQYIS